MLSRRIVLTGGVSAGAAALLTGCGADATGSSPPSTSSAPPTSTTPRTRRPSPDPTTDPTTEPTPEPTTEPPAEPPAEPPTDPLADPGIPDVEPGPVVRGSFESANLPGAPVNWGYVRPPGVTGPLPLAVYLHGYGQDAAQVLEGEWDLPRFLAAATQAGVPPFAIAVVDGGTGFFHPGASGEDAGALVLDELLPLLAERGYAPAGRRIGLLGFSMGGYGALRLAGILGPERVAAVAASSPGLYLDPATAAADGFGPEEEYAEYSIMSAQSALAGIPVRLDVGEDDGFRPAVEVYAGGFAPAADVTASITPGNHDLPYVHRSFPEVLAWLGPRLAAG